MVEAPFRAGIGASLSRGETPAWRRRKKMTPVRLPPGRARVETKPRLTGSSATRKTGAERAAAQFELGQQNYDRQAELFEKKFTAQATLDTFARNLETARQSLTGARAEEERARLAYTSNDGLRQHGREGSGARGGVQAELPAAGEDGRRAELPSTPCPVTSSRARSAASSVGLRRARSRRRAPS